jgi:taurine dioxygenase
MRILSSDDAQATQLHPILRKHPETGRPGVYGCFGYIIGIDGMREDDANALLVELYGWQDREQFRYRHVWAPDTLVMWDNRSVLHTSTGGYDGHARRLHRTTIGAR